jgi:putative RNA 2'-phosphotransferase
MDGWTNLDEFLIKLSGHLQTQVTLRDIEIILNNSEKKRFEFDLDKGLIRAKYGHTIDINPDNPKLDNAIKLYHGTAKANLASITEHGLISKQRLFVHLTSNSNLVELTAKRWSQDIVILEMNTEKMLEDDLIIYDAGEKKYF